jgi:hypothetical protein
MMQRQIRVLHDRSRPHVADHFGQSFESVADHEEHVAHAAVAQIGEHGHPELRALAAGAGPEPQDVALTVEGDADGRIERPVGDLPVADLDHDRVDEHRGVDLVQRAGGPVVHLLNHLVGDPRDRLLRYRGPVDLSEVRADLPGGQALGIERQHDLVHLGQSSLPFAHDLRLERAGPIPRHVDLDWAGVLGQHRFRPGAVADIARSGTSRIVLLIAQVLGHLLAQRGLEHRLGQLLEQPVRTSQRQTLAKRTSSTAACCSADCSASFFFAMPSSVVVIRRQPFPPGSRPARQAGNTVFRTVPSGRPAWGWAT